MRQIWIALLLFGTAAGPTSAQNIDEPFGTFVLQAGDKGKVLKTALDFSSELAADSVGFAACTLVRAVGEEDYQVEVEPAFEGRLLEPAPGGLEGYECAVSNFRKEGTTRVYLERMVEIRRESDVLLPYPERLTFEVRIQVLRGTSYREWHQITVRPADFDSSLKSVSTWRVIRYEVTGWQWMHEHSSSGGPVR